ncbi:MAG: ABC transporter substrate-binding protein [Deltaproteobacteria bacterium]|nr:ABC transporter substrate-binding protein [Deltaproteobacteria bacterium]
MKSETWRVAGRASVAGAALVLALLVAPAPDGGPLSPGFTAEAADKPRVGGTLKLGNAKGIGTPIPFVAFTSIPEYIKNNMYEPLVMYDQKGDIHPWLAESWSPNDDSSEWTFKIRKGVKFHNGKELTAEDVVWSVNHIREPANGAAGQGQLADNVASATAVDKHTVKFKAPGPRGLLPEILANTSTLHIAPAGSLATGQQKMKGDRPPAGTGPFKFKSWTPGQELHVVRHDDYWGGAPYLDGVRFIVIRQKAARAAAVQAGDVHLTERLGPTFVQRIDSKRIKGLHYMPIGAAGQRILTFNTKTAPVSDPRVRRAIALSLDKVAILDEATFGLGVPTLTWAVPGTDWEKALDFKWKRNVAEAKRLLKEAGYKGEPITLGATRGQGDPWTEPIMRQAAEAGIKFSLQNLGGAELIKKTINGELHVSVYGSGGTGEPLVANVQHLGCTEGKHGVSNVTRYCTADLEKLVTEYMEESDRAKRLSLWKKFSRTYFVDDVVHYIIGWSNIRNYVWRDEVKNWERGPTQEYWHATGGLWRTWLEPK